MKRRWAMAGVLLLGLAGCGQGGTDGGTAGETTLINMVIAGDERACASTQAEAVIRNIVETLPDNYFYNAEPQDLETSLDAVRLEMGVPEMNRLVCQATWHVDFEGERLASIPVMYSLQPDVQRSDVIVEVMGINGVRNEYSMANIKAGALLNDRALAPQRQAQAELAAEKAAEEATPERVAAREAESETFWAIRTGSSVCRNSDSNGIMYPGSAASAEKMIPALERSDDPYAAELLQCLRTRLAEYKAHTGMQVQAQPQE